jgi:hypothetical protein
MIPMSHQFKVFNLEFVLLNNPLISRLKQIIAIAAAAATAIAVAIIIIIIHLKKFLHVVL